MTQLEFTKKVAKNANVSAPQAKEWVQLIFNTLAEEIMTEDKVYIWNFGTFKRKVRKAKRRGDINTGELVTDPPKTVISFTPGEYLERMVAEAPLE